MQDGGGGPCMMYAGWWGWTVYDVCRTVEAWACMMYAGRWRWAVYDVCRTVEVGRV